MSVRIVHGANEGRFTLTGKTVSQIRHSLRDAFNIPEDAKALVGGTEVSGDHIVADGETVEFVRIFGRKGGLHDLWSEAEVQQFFSGKEMDELLKAGLQFTLRPTLTSEEIVEWSHRLRSREQQQVRSIPVSVDIERETVVVYGKAFDIDQQLAAVVKCLLDANGERRSQRDMKQRFPEHILDDRLDTTIRRKLVEHKSGVGRFIKSDTRGYRMVPQEDRA